jgi:hypothetical protein
MSDSPPNPLQKALQINLGGAMYGTFAEIGAGQEVARWFFLAGATVATVAKTMSAYDMSVSDAIYGKSDRYVSRKRLESMLAYEFDLVLQQLDAQRGEKSRFFAFANTIATRKFGSREDGQGWLGVRFQSAPRAQPSEVILHIIPRDLERVREQEAVGIVGVNLLYGIAYHHNDPAALMDSLMDNLTRDRVEIDMIRFSGPAFEKVDNRLMSLRLVEKKFTDAAMFTADGEVVQLAEILYKRPILVERGRFRPLTLVQADLLERARAQFMEDPQVKGEQPVVLLEMTLLGLDSEAGVDKQDFLARADILRALGHNALISHHGPFYQLAEHLSRYTQKPIGIAQGIKSLSAIMDEAHYHDLPGRALEAAGRLFKNNVCIYLYPWRDPKSNELVTAQTVQVAPNLRHLHAHLLENGHVVPIRSFNEEYLRIDPDEVLRQIQASSNGWEKMVPPAVADIIKRGRLFGYEQKSAS